MREKVGSKVGRLGEPSDCSARRTARGGLGASLAGLSQNAVRGPVSPRNRSAPVSPLHSVGCEWPVGAVVRVSV